MSSEVKKETSIIVCKSCKQPFERIMAGKYPDGRNKKWVDAEGREFCGLTCPSCHSSRVAVRNKNKRKLKEVQDNIKEPSNG